MEVLGTPGASFVHGQKSKRKMKKLLTLALMGCGLAASAQTDFQIKGDFDTDWVDCVPWTSTGNTTVKGTQPEGWTIANVPNVRMVVTVTMPLVGEEANGCEGKAVKLTNQSQSGQNIPGYMSLGKTFATAETKMTTVRNADGGAFGGVAFTRHPDAIRLQYKRDASNGTERASVIAYLWKGEWTQADVPGNTAPGVASYGSATKVTMTDRDRNVLGKETQTGGEVTKTADAQLVASVEAYISESNENWQELTAELDYGQFAGEEVAVENLNVVISANDYFADRSGIVSGNSLTVDNVELVYYHALKQLSYAGAQLNFNETQLNYDLTSEYYDASKLSFTKKGQAATVETAFNEATKVLTLTVKGENYSEDETAVTTYTIQFGTPLNSVLTEAAFDGESIAPKENGTVGVDHIYKEEKLTLTCGGDEEAKVERSYDEATGILTVTVTGSDVADNPDNVHVYKFQFNLPLNSVLSKVTYEGNEVTLGADGETEMEGSYKEGGFTFVCEADPDARIEQSYDDETRTLTVKVTGSDVAENPGNVHVYKFVFAYSTGIARTALASSYDVYTLSGVQIRKGAASLSGLPKGVYVINGKKTVVR